MKSKKTAKSNFLRFCFAKGICKKGANNRVEGLNKGTYSTVSKALQGNEKAKKRLEKREKLQGAGDVLSKKDKEKLKDEIAKRVQEQKEAVIKRSKGKSFKEVNFFSDGTETDRDLGRKHLLKLKRKLRNNKIINKEDRKELQFYMRNSNAKTKKKDYNKAIKNIKETRINVEANRILSNDKELAKLFLKSRGKRK